MMVKFNISSFKSAKLLAGFLHQQFCFLRQKISFFRFDCKQIGGCPLIHPRLCVHANRRRCGINNESRSSIKTNKKKQLAYFSNYNTWLSLARFLSEANLTWDHQGFSESKSILTTYLLLDNWVETIIVWQRKEICQALENFIPSRGSHECWSYLYSSG